jgi:hypothetical protein
MNTQDRDQAAQKTQPPAKPEKNGGNERKFPRPQAWALRWDGLALSKVEGNGSPPQKPKSR